MKAWGFEYKTVAFAWDKVNPNPGYYTLSQVELCLVGKRGMIPKPRGARNVRQFVSEKKTRHSGKPEEVRKRIEQMKSDFLSTVSHELRTPLTSIAGALGLLAGGAFGPFPPGVQQMLEIAFKNSQHLSYLINDLLDMDKLLAGKMILTLQAQPLMPLIDRSLRENQ